MACCEAFGALQHDLTEAEASRRIWRVRCIQAEAELRALQARYCNDAGDATAPTVPCGSSRSSGAEAGAGDTGGDAHGEDDSEPRLGARAAATAQLAQRHDPRTHGLEAHVAELAQWSEEMHRKAAAAMSLKDACADQLKDEEYVAAQMEKDSETFERHAFQLLERIVNPDPRVRGDITSLQMDLTRLESELADSASVHALATRVEGVLEDLRTAVHHQEEARDSAQLHKESMLLTVDEARTHAQHLEDEGQQHTKEAAGAKKAAAARGRKLSQLQNEIQRERKIVKKRQQALESTVENQRTQLDVARNKVQDSVDQMKKLQQRQLRQVTDIRKSGEGIQEEVSESQTNCEAVKSELQSISQEEEDLHRLFKEQVASIEAVENNVMQVTSELQRAGEELDMSGSAWSATEEECRATERERQATVQRLDELTEEELLSRARLAECEEGLREVGIELTDVSEAHALREEIFRKCEEVSEEIKIVEANNVRLSEQIGQLRQGQQTSQKEREKHLLDLQEAVRRADKLREQHHHFLKSLRSLRAKGKDAVAAASSEALGTLAKKLEGLLSFLEGSARNKRRLDSPEKPGPASSANGKAPQQKKQAPVSNTERRLSAVTEVNQAVVQRRLSKEHQVFSELLEEEKKRASIEQRKMSEATSSHSLYLIKAKREQQRDVEELQELRDALVAVRKEEAHEIDDLEVQLRCVLQDEAQHREETVNRFEILLQREECEQHAAQERVEELSEQVRLLNQRPCEDEPSVRRRLAETEAETEALRAESRKITDMHTELLAETVQRQRAYRECTRKVRRLQSEAVAKLVVDPPLGSLTMGPPSAAGSSSCCTPSRPASSGDYSQVISSSPIRPTSTNIQDFAFQRKCLTLPLPLPTTSSTILSPGGHFRSASGNAAIGGSSASELGHGHRRTNSCRITSKESSRYVLQVPASPREAIAEWRYVPSNESPPRGVTTSISPHATPRSSRDLKFSPTGRHLSPASARQSPMPLVPGSLPSSPEKSVTVTKSF